MREYPKNTKRWPFSKQYSICYIGYRHSIYGGKKVQKSLTLSGLIKLIQQSFVKEEDSSKVDSSLQNIDNLDIICYIRNGQEFFVPRSIYSRDSEHGVVWLDDIPEHFSLEESIFNLSDLSVPVKKDNRNSYKKNQRKKFNNSKEPLIQLGSETKEKAEEELTYPEETPIKTDLKPIFESEVESILDARERVVAAVVRRRGQPEFRKALIDAYDSACAITGCNAVEALEAAHISPYRGPDTNRPSNGLLLRADLHTLFDLGLIAVDTKTMTVVIAESLINTTYAEINGQSLRLPAKEAFRPNLRALDKHRSESKVG